MVRRLRHTLVVLVLAVAASAIALASGGDERELAPSVVRVGKGELVVRDPAGGPSFVLRSYERDGRQCLRYGRRRADRLQPPHDITCLPAGRMERPVALSVSGSWIPPEPRTIVSGFVDPSVRRLTVAGPGAARTFEFAGGRVFLAVYEGYVAAAQLPVTATLANGRKVRVDWGAGMRVYAPDPDHGPPWYVSAERFRARAGQRRVCTQFGREMPRFGGDLEQLPGRVICGRLDRHPYFFALSAWDVDRRPRPGIEHTRVTKPTHWVLFGASTRAVSKIEVATPAGTRELKRSAENGGFIAVFSARDLARSDVTVMLTMADGRKVRYVGPTDVNRAARPDQRRAVPRRHVKRGTCQVRGSRTLLRTPRGRVFSVLDGRQTRYYACPFNPPARLPLQRGGVFRLPALTRPYISWVSERAIERVRFPGAALPSIPLVGGRVRALVVTPDGWVAWIQQRPAGVFEVWRFDSRGRQRLDRGHVNALSLCRMGSRVFWTHRDGKPRYHACDLAGERTAFMR